MKIIPVVRDCVLTLASVAVVVRVAQKAREAGRTATRPRDKADAQTSVMPPSSVTPISVNAVDVQAYHKSEWNWERGTYICTVCEEPFPCEAFRAAGIALLESEIHLDPSQPEAPIMVQAYGDEERRSFRFPGWA